MNFMDKFQNSLEKIMGPLAQKITESKIISAMMPGMMTSLVITMGIAAISILSAIPFEPWQNILTSTGIGEHMNAVVSATTSLLALYIVPGIAYHYAKNEGENGLTAAIIALAIFIALQPQSITVGEEVLSVLQQKYLGSQGIFVGMVSSILVAMAYCKLMKKNIKMKLPESVPPMVSDSLSPIFVSMIMFTSVLVIRYIVGFTPYGNIFDLINTLITTPFLNLAATPMVIILFQTFLNLAWFFGIHPAPFLNVLYPILIQLNIQNIDAFLSGTPASALPYLNVILIGSFCYLGGQGNTLSLAALMVKAKSEKFKSMSKIALIPNIFNINEPMIFGVPIILNPYFLVPMVLTPLVGGLFGMVALNVLGVGASANPVVALALPWVLPSFVQAFLIGGWRFCVAIVGAFLIHAVIWYPFFKVADKKEYEEEQRLLQEANTAQE